jgi:antiviral helicase SKI2
MTDILDCMTAVSNLDLESDTWIDSILEETRPRKRVKPSDEERRKELEKTFLEPSQRFGTEWLNRLQQYVYPTNLCIKLS